VGSQFSAAVVQTRSTHKWQWLAWLCVFIIFQGKDGGLIGFGSPNCHLQKEAEVHTEFEEKKHKHTKITDIPHTFNRNRDNCTQI